MRRSISARLFALLLAAGCSGCEKASPKQTADMVDAQVELKLGADASDDVPQLKFRIVAIHENQMPLDKAPFHQSGGQWTYLECQAGAYPRADFIVGVAGKKSDDGLPLAWGKAYLAVSDRQAGANFIEIFARTFPGRMPEIGERNFLPIPLRINTAVLGEAMERAPEGGFSRQHGAWVASKWFPEFDGKAAEVYFNYNLGDRIGEFSEKDPDYADDLLAILASALRDGPRPERTPEIDPNITRTGPRVGPGRQLLDRNVSEFMFSPGGKYVVYQDELAIFALGTNDPASKPVELARFENSPRDLRVANDGLELLVVEGIQEDPRYFSSEDPMRVWWVSPKSRQNKLIRGPEKGLSLEEAAISPDLRYIALHQWREKPGSKQRMQILLIHDRQTEKTTEFHSPGIFFTVINWKNAPAGMQAVALTNRWRIDETERSVLYLADPASGALHRQDVDDARLEVDNILSPDGKHRMHVGVSDLIVTDVASGVERRFVFHEDDRSYVGEESTEWASPRYLLFHGQRASLIDVTTMKMSFPGAAPGPGAASHDYKFSPDMRWALYQGDDESPGLFLAPVELPQGE